VIFWAAGGVSEWFISYDYGRRWWKALEDWVGDRTRGRVPLKNYAGLTNIGIHCVSPGKYFIVATKGSGTGTRSLANRPPRTAGEVYRQLDTGEPQFGGVEEITSVLGLEYPPADDPESETRSAIDPERFKAEFQKIWWEGTDITDNYQSLDFTYVAGGDNYMIMEVSEFGQLGSVVGYFNHEPGVEEDDDLIDKHRHEHWFVPGRMPDSMATDIFTQEKDTPLDTLSEDPPNVPWEFPSPIEEP